MTSAVTSAVAAAAAVARAHGVVVAWPRVLHVGANIVVHLAPAPVVARVAATTALVRPHPGEHLALEVDLARWAADAGAAVVEPCRGALAGPHVRDGQVMSFWPLVSPAVFPTDPASVGRSLARLHGVLAGYRGDLSGPERIAADAHRIAQLLGRLDLLPTHEVVAVCDEAREVVADLRALAGRGPWQALHGDPHPWNAVASAPGGVRWWDLEDAWRGPVEFDLAVLARTTRLDGDAAVAAYVEASGHEVDDELLATCHRLRAVQRVWAPLLAHVRANTPQ
jgi:hypothetical protein